MAQASGLLKRSPFCLFETCGFFNTKQKGAPPLTSCNVQVYNASGSLGICSTLDESLGCWGRHQMNQRYSLSCSGSTHMRDGPSPNSCGPVSSMAFSVSRGHLKTYLKHLGGSLIPVFLVRASRIIREAEADGCGWVRMGAEAWCKSCEQSTVFKASSSFPLLAKPGKKGRGRKKGNGRPSVFTGSVP